MSRMLGQGFKPTPRKELIGRVALGVLGGLFVVVGVWFWRWCASGLGADEFEGVLVLLAVLGGIFVLHGVVFVGMAFVPAADRGRGPPREFVVVSRVLGWFWAGVGALIGW